MLKMLTLLLMNTFFLDFGKCTKQWYDNGKIDKKEQCTDYNVKESLLTDKLISGPSTSAGQLSKQSTLQSTYGSTMERIDHFQTHEMTSEFKSFELINQSIAKINDTSENILENVENKWYDNGKFEKEEQVTKYNVKEYLLTDGLISRQSTGTGQISKQSTLQSILGSAIERIEHLQTHETTSEVKSFELTNELIVKLNDPSENNQNILLKIDRMEKPITEEDIRQLIYHHLEPHLPFLYNDIEIHKLYNPEIHQVIEEKFIVMLNFYGKNYRELEASEKTSLYENINTCMKLIEEEVARGSPCWLCQYDKYTAETTFGYLFVPIISTPKEEMIVDFREETAPLCTKCKKIQDEISSEKVHWIELSGHTENGIIVTLRFSTLALLSIVFNADNEFTTKKEWYKEFLCDDYPFCKQNVANLPVVIRQINQMLSCHFCIYCNEVPDYTDFRHRKLENDDYCSNRHRIMHKITTPLKFFLLLTQFYFKVILLILTLNFIYPTYNEVLGEYAKGWDWDYTLGHPMRMNTALVGVLFEPVLLLILYCYHRLWYGGHTSTESLYHYYYTPRLPHVTDTVPTLKLNLDVPFPEYEKGYIFELRAYTVFYLINFQPKIILLVIQIIIAGYWFAFKSSRGICQMLIVVVALFVLVHYHDANVQIYSCVSSSILLLTTIFISFRNIAAFIVDFLMHELKRSIPVKVTYFILRLLAKGMLLYICMHEELTGAGEGAEINDTYGEDITRNHPIIMPSLVGFISLEPIISLVYYLESRQALRQPFDTTMFNSFFSSLANDLKNLESFLYSVFIVIFYVKGIQTGIFSMLWYIGFGSLLAGVTILNVIRKLYLNFFRT